MAFASVLGLAVIGWILASNPKIYAKPADGPWFSGLELVYYAAGIASIALGWYFNIHFVLNAHGQGSIVQDLVSRTKAITSPQCGEVTEVRNEDTHFSWVTDYKVTLGFGGHGFGRLVFAFG